MVTIYTVEQAAEKVGVTPRQLRHWVQIGSLKFMRVGRRIYFTEKHFEDLIDRTTEKNLSRDEIKLE